MGAKIMLANAANNRADTYWRVGKYDLAARNLEEAMAIAVPADGEPHKELQSSFLLTAALAALSQRKNGEALTRAHQVLSLVRPRDNDLTIGARGVLCLAQAASGKSSTLRMCEDALTIARTLRNPLTLSQALLALAQAAFATGNAERALEVAGEAQQRFTAANQPESEWRAFAIAGLAANKLVQDQKARQLGTQAIESLNRLERTLGGENYRTYLERPDVLKLRAEILPIAGR
jgi:tetratricopeptide (TPR) repeat protein